MVDNPIPQQLSLPELTQQWLEPPYKPMEDLKSGIEYFYGAVAGIFILGMLGYLVRNISLGFNRPNIHYSSVALRLEDLKLRGSYEIGGNAAYDHYTGEILVPPWWKKEPFYLVSIAHEVGHMLHHQEIGTKAYETTPSRVAEKEAWERGYETAKGWGIEDEYKRIWRSQLTPFR